MMDRPSFAGADVLSGGGEMGAYLRGIAWEKTAVGHPSLWPQSLKTALSMMLETHFPMYIAWGREFTQFYNDGYRPILGSQKHPKAMGSGTRDTFPEIWSIIGPMFEGVMEGKAVGFADYLLPLDRHGFVEECYFVFSYSPIRDESGGVGGVLTTCTETTSNVLGKRRLLTLRDLAAGASQARSVEDACAGALEVLARNAHDLPFAVLHSWDEGTRSLTRAGTTGIDGEAEIERLCAALPLARAFEENRPLVEDISLGVTAGPWPERPRQARVIPVTRPGQERPYGVLTVGISSRLRLDEPYRDFLELVADHIASSIGAARSYEEERRRVEALAEIDRAKTQFFSNVSHEFRTPLTLLLGPLEDNLAEADGVPPIQFERQQLAYRNALRLLKLVNSLLDFSRIEAGRANARFSRTDVSQVTSDLAGLFRSAVEKAGLRLIVRAEAFAEPVWVDREMWEKIVLNLLSNAFKFTFEGEIEVVIGAVDGKARLRVRDTGIGIPASELPNLFKRFHRVEGAKGRTYEGTGIGLALVQELVRLHGGSISVESRPGSGTEFRVEIPLGAGHLPADRLAPEEPYAAAEGSSLLGTSFAEEALRWLPEPRRGRSPGSGAAGPRILVADDNADMRSYLESLLPKEWDCRFVADGDQALASVRESRPDLILSDVMMPGMDGFELIHRLRRDPSTRGVPVILLSARAGEESKVEGLRAGADDYLVKPFSAKELLARVRTHLELGRLRASAETERSRLDEVFRQAPAGIAMLEGPEHVFVLTNPVYMAMFFEGEGDFIGKPCREAIPETGPQGFIDLLDSVYRTGKPHVGTEAPLSLARPDGTRRKFYINFVYEPYRAPSGEILGVIAVATDVTEQVETRLELERAVTSRDEFLSIASHELRTPLTSLKLQSQLRRRDVAKGEFKRFSPEKLPRLVADDERQLDRLIRLVDDMLDVSRVQSGKLSFSTEEFDLCLMVRDTISRFAAQIEAKGCELSVRAEGGIVGTWDRFRLEQVVINLITNALKYGEGTPIEVRVQAREGRAQLIVSDRGMGVAKRDQDRIFERFERAVSANSISGLGVGLYISRRIVEAHGGSIRVASELGEGATFVVDLPLQKGTPAEGLKTALPDAAPDLAAPGA